jgi:tetratricopeptide (TPR) repeat protein
LLRYFVEHPGVVISKNELAAAIWNDTSVTDNALVQCIVEIRRGLNDDPHDPRFIKTLPKVGYRFIAPVEAAPDQPRSPRIDGQSDSQQTGPQDFRGDKQLEPTLPRPTRSNLAARSFGRICGRLAPLLSLLLLLFGLHGDIGSDIDQATLSLPSVAGPPVLVVFPLVNETGRQDMDWLREGLSDMILTDLAHMGQWKVLSRENTHTLLEDGTSAGAASLKRMLDAATSVHAKDFVVGTVSKSGQQIVVRVDTRDGNDGHLVTTDSVALNGSREIVADADLLSADISRRLGFSRNQVPSLGAVMTRNVDAYRYYSLGVEKAEQFQNSQAIELFEKAIEYDPNFAMAYAQIGYEYAAQKFQPQKARPYFEHALHLSAQLSALNRLYIEAWSAIGRSDLQAAISILRQITKQYPDEIDAYCQLSRILREQERVDEAANLLKDGIQKNPNAKDLYNALGVILILMERPQEAIGALKQYVVLAPQNPNAHDSLGMAYQLAGQYGASQSEYNEALKLDPEFEPSVAHLGDVYYQEGRYRDALNEYRHLVKVAGQSSDAKAIGYADLAVVYRAMGNLAEAQTAAEQEIRNNRSAIWDSLVMALDRNQRSRATVLQQTLLSDPSNSKHGSEGYLRMEFFYRGYIALKTGDPHEAISQFKLALQHLPPSSGIDLHEDCLANAYLELGMLKDAIAEYQRILKINPNYPLVYYHLGFSYRRIHDRANAIAAFQHFLQANPSADQDSPPVLEARRFLQGDS